MSEVAEPAKKKYLVSVCLPAYNEAANIAREIETIRSAMAKTDFDYEFIVVDDGSTDGTAELAEKAGVRVVRHGANRGGGVARNTGILEARGDIIVASDADGTYPHETIPKLLSYFPDYDMVIGARVGEVVQEPWYRKLPKYLIARLASALSGIDIPDLNSGFRAFKKETVLSYFSLLPPGHSWAGTITLAFLCNGHPVMFMPINYYKRKGGPSSFMPVADTYSYILLIVRAIMYFNPLRVLLPLGFFVFSVGFLKTVYDFFKTQIGGWDVFLLVASVQIVSLGFIADLIAVLHRRNTAKP